MGARLSIVLKSVTFSLLGGLLWIGAAPQARAASLCAPAVTQPVVGTCTVTTTGICMFVGRNPVCSVVGGTCTFGDADSGAPCFVKATPTCSAQGVCPVNQFPRGSTGTACTATSKTATGMVLKNGLCTNDLGGFSGAALASQALSGLAQTTTQATTRSTENTIVDRRERERQRCPEGMSRVNGNCERTPPSVTEVAPPAAEVEAVPPVPPPPPEAHALKKVKKAKIAAIPEKEAPAPAPGKAAISRKRAPAHPKIVRVAPPPPPLPIEAPVRYGTWGQVYGDYEHRNATGPASVFSLVANAPVPLDLNVQSKSGTVGFQAGADLTTRALFSGDDGLIMGGFAGYVSSNLKLNTSSNSTNLAAVPDGLANLHANLTGPELGLYATYFNREFSTDFLLKVDVLTLNESFNDNVGFAPGPNDAGTPPFNSPYSGTNSVGLLSTTLAGNLNYRFDLYPNSFGSSPRSGRNIPI